MQEIKAIIRNNRLEDVLRALHELPDLPGVTVSKVVGVGQLRVAEDPEATFGHVHMTKIEVVVPSDRAEVVVAAIESAARTGKTGDGKIFIADVNEAVRIRTGDRGAAVL